MVKKAIAVCLPDGKPVQACEVREFDTAKDFREFEEGCAKAMGEFLSDVRKYVSETERRIHNLEAEIRHLKGEYDDDQYLDDIIDG